MNKDSSKLLLDAYFEQRKLTSHNLESFNVFVDKSLQKIIDENKYIVPDILPNDVTELKIRMGKIWIETPSIKEADGTKRMITPTEARIRNITYEAPLMLELTVIKDDVEEESKQVCIGGLPIMVKSKYCCLNGLTEDELINVGEDPHDQGGYFIINGTERIIIVVEDLAPNKILVEKSTAKKGMIAKVFSDDGQYKILHNVYREKDGIISMNFSRVKEVPAFGMLKALGFFEDQDILKILDLPEEYMGEIYVNLLKISDLKNENDSFDLVGKKMGITYNSAIRIERAEEIIDKSLFPHIGHSKDSRILKAYYLASMIRKVILSAHGKLSSDDKDHYKNKRLKLCKEMMESLFRSNFRMFIGDMKYNFERLVKKGKMPLINSITRGKLLTSMIKRSLATGQWVGGRQGVSQHLERNNYYGTLAHLRRVASLLTSQRENFKARDLHPSHYGRLCVNETPDGPNVGLRKNLAIMAEISIENSDDEEIMNKMVEFGLKRFEQ
ncbi:MAG: DNA-directed RNA polymerase subunit B'' [Candidatus Nanoarchaeia archaeon]|nr:DNA-directed RNA polymerase subunit B'' [Candidatus Nanoarchaeia archaeon]